MRLGVKNILVVLVTLCATFTVGAQTEWSQQEIEVYFNVDDADLLASQKTEIREKIIAVGPSNIRKILISGHADEDASVLYNDSLSLKRAENTRAYLLTQGVRNHMVELDFFGERSPHSVQKSKNRRVDIILLYTPPEIPNRNIKRPVLIGEVYNGKNQQKMGCDFAVEQPQGFQYDIIPNHGKFMYFPSQLDSVSIIFSRDGFLSKRYNLSVQDWNQIQTDTLKLKVALNPVKVVEKLTFDKIYFYTDEARFKPESRGDLNKLLRLMKSEKDLHIEIQGHMNYPKNRPLSQSQKKYNYDLSHRRAKAVYEFLIANGIAQERLTYKGLSNYKMVYPYPKNKTEGDLNKRVEVWKLQIVN